MKRTIEISEPSELHIRNKQLEITQYEKTISIPLEDISLIFTIGPDIRISSFSLSTLAKNKILFITLDYKYLPTAIVTPYKCNARQVKILNKQILLSQSFKDTLWLSLIDHKIQNQIRCLSLLGLNGIKELTTISSYLTIDSINEIETLTAKTYFTYYHPGLNRRNDDPINSRVNYSHLCANALRGRSFLLHLPPRINEIEHCSAYLYVLHDIHKRLLLLQ